MQVPDMIISRHPAQRLTCSWSLQNAIAVNTVVVFSKTYCPYSKAAKELLAEEYADLKPTIFESVLISSSLCVHVMMSLSRLDKRDDGDKIQDYLEEKTGQRSVPNIFISAYRTICVATLLLKLVVLDRKHIGGKFSGSDALKELHAKEEIRPLLG